MIKRWICILFHKKQLKTTAIRGELFNISSGHYRGCLKCDVWKRVDKL